jgi:hypothetical protein
MTMKNIDVENNLLKFLSYYRLYFSCSPGSWIAVIQVNVMIR